MERRQAGSQRVWGVVQRQERGRNGMFPDKGSVSPRLDRAQAGRQAAALGLSRRTVFRLHLEPDGFTSVLGIGIAGTRRNRCARKKPLVPSFQQVATPVCTCAHVQAVRRTLE